MQLLRLACCLLLMLPSTARSDSEVEPLVISDPTPQELPSNLAGDWVDEAWGPSWLQVDGSATQTSWS